jgi:hypothetical protein
MIMMMTLLLTLMKTSLPHCRSYDPSIGTSLFSLLALSVLSTMLAVPGVMATHALTRRFIAPPLTKRRPHKGQNSPKPTGPDDPSSSSPSSSISASLPADLSAQTSTAGLAGGGEGSIGGEGEGKGPMNRMEQVRMAPGELLASAHEQWLNLQDALRAGRRR